MIAVPTPLVSLSFAVRGRGPRDADRIKDQSPRLEPTLPKVHHTPREETIMATKKKKAKKKTK